MKLCVEDGCFSYHPKVGPPVLEHLQFTLESGEILAILGPNGAGKTTLLRCLMGFLPWTQGRSLLDGTPLPDIPAHLLWQKLAYVPQARGKASGALVEDLVLLGRSSRIGLFRRPGRADCAAVDRVLEKLSLTGLRGRRCDEISGGELQMALIARALAAEPACIILDEPESNLDFKNQLIVLQTLEALRGEGIACIFNTHYPEHALRCADKALVLEKGGGALCGPTSEVVTEKTLAAAFGVRSIIGEMETDTHIYRDILAVALLEQAEQGTLAQAAPALRTASRTDGGADASPAPLGEEPGQPRTVLATLCVLVGPQGQIDAVNRLLHGCGNFIDGRFGMPCPEHGVNIITVVLDAPEDAVRSLTQRLNAVPGVSVKTTYASL